MPTDKDFKRLVRARMGKTGEAYTTDRAHLRPDPDPRPAGRFQGRNPDTAALTRLLAALGVTDPAALGELLAGLRERVLDLADAEEAAAAGLRTAVPDAVG